MKYYLTVDFGSTYTKICAIDADNKKVLGTSKAFTTIHTDVRNGFDAALKELTALVGRLEYNERLACSSAGGGLKMIALGLVPELTAKAARMAASSAGAKVINTYSYELSSRELEEIRTANPDIVLLCGGTDGGNKEVIIQNAKKIAGIDRDFSVIYAGNKSAADEAEEILRKANKNVIVCGNVMPVFNELDTAPAKNAIRSLFIERIIEARGLSEIQKEMTADIIPTPLAVFNGLELFAKGCHGNAGMGDFMAVDVGGATTDVYTMCEGKPGGTNVIIKGLPELYAKRSVEGDLGLRYNIDSLADSADFEKAASDFQVSIDPKNLLADTVKEWVNVCKNDPGIIPEPGSIEKKIDEYLTHHAIDIAVERHCGTVESVYTPAGEMILISGKDLTNVPAVIGTGGPVINADDPVKVLEGSLFKALKPAFLKPVRPKFFLDRKNIFASMGLVGRVNPELALQIMKEEISEI